MLRYLALVVFALALANPGMAKAEDVPLEMLLREVKQALLDVQKSPEASSLPSLKSATLNVSTVQKKEGGPTFKLWIIEFGKKKSSELVTTLSIELSPPPSQSSASISTLDISDTLADAMLAAGRGIEAASADNPPLVVNEVKVTLKFGVSRTTSGAIKVELLPVTLSGSGEFTRSDIQEIILIYSK